MLDELNPCNAAFWKASGKFLKRLGPVIPIASWLCYLMPSLATGYFLLCFYAGFIVVTWGGCFLRPKSLSCKINNKTYSQGSRSNFIKKVIIIIDAIFTGLIAFSLACFMAILLFKAPATPLVEVLIAGSRINNTTKIISLISITLSVLRYQQKRHSLELKMFAYDLRQGSADTNLERLNCRRGEMNALKYRLIRVICDCLIIFYNIFFVSFSLGMLFLGSHMSLLFHTYFIWKMIGLGSLMTVKVSRSNHKLSVEYLRDKIAIISQYDWCKETESFVASKGDDAGVSR